MQGLTVPGQPTLSGGASWTQDQIVLPGQYDTETIKMFLIFHVISVYLSHPFYFRLYPFWLKVAVNYMVIQMILLWIQWMYLSISILMLNSQAE